MSMLSISKESTSASIIPQSNSALKSKQFTINEFVTYAHLLWLAIVFIGLLIFKKTCDLKTYAEQLEINQTLLQICQNKRNETKNNLDNAKKDALLIQQQKNNIIVYKQTLSIAESSIQNFKWKIFIKKLQVFVAKNTAAPLNLLLTFLILTIISLLMTFFLTLGQISFESSLRGLSNVLLLFCLEIVITCIGIMCLWGFDLSNQTIRKQIVITVLFHIFVGLIFGIILYKKWFRYIPPTPK